MSVGELIVMVPNKPGLEETEGLGAGASVEESPQPEITMASNSAEELALLESEEASEAAIPEPESEVSEPVADAPQAESPSEATPAETAPVELPEVEETLLVAPAEAFDEAATNESDEPLAAEASAESPTGETPTESPAAEKTPAQLSGIKRGDVIEGTITATSPTSVTVDIGNGVTGIVPARELERMNRKMLESLKPGEKLTVFIVNEHDYNGNVLLSVNRAVEEMDWQRAEEYRQSQDVYESRVAGYNKGGLIVRFGRLRGFVPQSQMSAERRRVVSGETPEDRWGQMVNEAILVKVMEVDRSRNRLILSERSAARETREKRKESLISHLTAGEVRMGRVVSLEDFGAFVDIGGAEGLVHLTELSWQHVNHPREMLKVGQEVKVEVISVDPDAKRIGLSIKRQAPDPWDLVATTYTIGQLVQATVTKLTKFGAFAQLVDLPEIEGLIHISELSDKRVSHPREVVQEDDKMTLRIVKMDIKNRRLGLSLKRVNSAEYLDLDWTVGASDEEEEN
jgi:small subunit ribosomal protein S1